MGHINLKTKENIFRHILIKTCIYYGQTQENNFNNIVKNVTCGIFWWYY